MSGSVSTELSYGGPLHYPSGDDMPSNPDERAPAQAAEQPPDISSPPAPDTVSDTQPDNRLSVISAVSLEPRRRSRHHHSRHSHLHRELAHMLSISSRDTKELRRGLSAAFDKLDQSRQRASHAEKLAVEMLLRVKQAEEERANAMRQASTVREELGKYKALVDNAHGEIRRAQQMLEDQEQLRYEAESSAARARDNARQIKQKRLIELAREQGHKMGYNEGIQAGQRIGHHEGQSPLEEGNFYPDDEPRFREIFNESRYRLDEFDQSPPFRDVFLNRSSPHDAEVPLPTPLPTRQVYPRLHARLGESLGQSNGAANLPQEPPYTSTSSPRGVQRTTSTDSSSTTTLPAAPATVHVSSRAPPPMPTIPEVSSSEVGSVSRRSRSIRDSPSTQNHTPQMSSHNGVHPSVVPLTQGDAAFAPPPGIVEDPPSGPNNGYYPESGGPVYEAPSPRRGFDNHSILSNGVVPDISRSPVREHFSSTAGAIHSPARERFESIPGDMRSPAQEYFTVIRTPTSRTIGSPAQEHFSTTHSHRDIPSPAQEHFTTAHSHRDIPSPAQEHFTTTYSPRAAGSHIDGDQLMDGRQHPEFLERPSSRSRGPPRRRPIPQMPAPLAPQFSVHAPYDQGSHSSTVHRRSSASDDQLPRDARMNAAANTASNRHVPVSQFIPNSFEPQPSAYAPYDQGSHSSELHRRPSESDNQMPRDARMNATSNATSNRHVPAPQFIPDSVQRPVSRDSTHRTNPTSSVYQRDTMPEQRTYAMSPRGSSEQRLHSSAPHADPRVTAVPHFYPGNPPAGQPMESQNHRPSVHVHVPPSRYDTPNSASPRAATPLATRSHVSPSDMHSPYATFSNPNVSTPDIANQSPRRYPPTLYNEPNLQRPPTTTNDYEQEGWESPPGLPVPSRESRTMSPRIVIPPAESFSRNSYAAGQRTTITSPHRDTPTDALPVRPPSVSPRPTPAGFSLQVSPTRGPTRSPTPRRPASPNPLPRGISPAPLPRAASPAPLPVRSPSVRSTRINRSASDVSLPGAHGSPYMHYNPELEADIAVLASSSAAKLREANR